MNGYMIGQRVISGFEIVTVIPVPRGLPHDESQVWIRTITGLEQWRALHNVRPLPNGQL